MSAFVEYWRKLKTEKPTIYQEKLKSNRERIRNLRKEIYADKAKHEEYKKRQREAYQRRKLQKNKKV